MRETIETTYADLRPDDLVIDKAGKAWPVDEVGQEKNLDDSIAAVTFWLCDPVTKANMHFMAKNHYDKVTVSRIPKQADEAAKLEAEFPTIDGGYSGPVEVLPDEAVANVEAIGGTVEADFPATKGRLSTSPEEQAELQARFPKDNWAPPGTVNDSYLPSVTDADYVHMAEAVANTERILGATVEAEVTAEEVDAANASTEEKPNHLPPFESMTILEMRSHLYLLHGLYAHDMKSRDETIAMHTKAHAEHDAGRLQTPAHIPHTHDGEALK